MNIHNSHYLPLHGFSFWGAYLLSLGISLEQIKKFSNIVRPMLLGSFDDVPADFSNVEEQLTELFRNTSALSRSRAL